MKSGFSFQFHYTSNINQERLVGAIARVMVIDQVAVAFFSFKKKFTNFNTVQRIVTKLPLRVQLLTINEQSYYIVSACVYMLMHSRVYFFGPDIVEPPQKKKKSLSLKTKISPNTSPKKINNK